MDKLLRAYLETALWAETDNSNEQGGDPLDKNYTVADFAEGELDKAKADCARFAKDNTADIQGEDLWDIGHDFWLTRNGHGAGFWDGDYEEAKGRRLSEASKKFGEVTIYVGDDSKLRFA